MKDIREDWFMNKHFSKDELEEIYQWEQEAGKVAKIITKDNFPDLLNDEYFALVHINDLSNRIILCSMKEEYMLRRWAERLGYTINDGKTAKQFEEENGIKDEPINVGKEIFRGEGSIERTSITQFGERKFTIVSGDFAVIAKRTASNSIQIELLDSHQYAIYLEQQKK